MGAPRRGGVSVANEHRPLVISMSRRGVRSTFCYIGQTIKSVDDVKLDLTDGSTIRATLLDGELPVKLWVAFTDRTAVPITLRAIGHDAELAIVEIDKVWPTEGNALWGPIDDDDIA